MRIQLGQLHFAAALIRARVHYRRAIFFAEPHLSRDYSHRIRDEYTLVTMLIHRSAVRWGNVHTETRPSAETKKEQRNYCVLFCTGRARPKYCGCARER